MDNSGANKLGSGGGVGSGEEGKACTRGHWRPAEDEKLRHLVEQYGAHNWNAIAEKLQGRSGISNSVSNEFSLEKIIPFRSGDWIISFSLLTAE